ncbi:E3 ubiquitin-protein ligase RNFT1-like [Littorina saxatilis]|uniref:RING-type domain-containing protein n=1 Tax=Littorina saxatilis TaxID=31220 RepID=A0AAN9FXP2_9CAEN
MASNGQESHGGQPPGNGSQSGLWPLAGLQSRYTRSAMDIAQELLPNLPRRAVNTSTAGPRSVQSASEGQAVVDMSSLMAAEEGHGEPLTFTPQVAARMEEIRAMLQNMNSQQQQQHQHTHSHLSSQDSPPQGDHSHGHSHGDDTRGEGQGGGGGPQVDMRGLVKLLQTSGVFFVLLLLRFLYDHRLGLVVMVAMGGTFYYVNMKLVQCIHQTAVREGGSGRWLSVGYPLWLVFFLSVNIFLLYYSFRDQALWNTLQYKMPIVAEVDVWTLLWIVLVTDFTVKFATVALKCCIFLIPPACLPHRRRGKYYMFVERLSQLYRLTIPILPWVHYLHDDQEIGRWFAIATVIIYIIFKITSIFSAVKEVLKAGKKLTMQMSFGSKPGAEDLRQRGAVCPICQDNYKEPILLACKHIFCENCVSLWFDREKTCPMCRAQITDDPQWQDGSTTPSLQWF